MLLSEIVKSISYYFDPNHFEYKKFGKFIKTFDSVVVNPENRSAHRYEDALIDAVTVETILFDNYRYMKTLQYKQHSKVLSNKQEETMESLLELYTFDSDSKMSYIEIIKYEINDKTDDNIVDPIEKQSVLMVIQPNEPGLNKAFLIKTDGSIVNSLNGKVWEPKDLWVGPI